MKIPKAPEHADRITKLKNVMKAVSLRDPCCK